MCMCMYTCMCMYMWMFGLKWAPADVVSMKMLHDMLHDIDEIDEDTTSMKARLIK